jgi:uncharacterized protein YndB with AHSA1/START domain
MSEEPPSIDVTTEATIRRPRTEVATYAADPDNAPEWYANISSVRWKTAPPLQIGSELEFVARFLGGSMAYTYRVLEYDPAERLVMRTIEGPFPMETTYTWADAEDAATEMTLRNRGEPDRFSKLSRPFVVRAMRRNNRKDLARLRSILEGNG